jgi:hypothetical protein
MKKFCLTTAIVFFLLICNKDIQGQTMQPQLNQVELMKQFVGTWQNKVDKDTIDIWDCQQYGNAFVSTIHRLVNNKESFLLSENWVFSPMEGKFIGFTMLPSGNYMTWISSFIDENKWTGVYLLKYNTDEVIGKFELTLDNPTEIVASTFNKNGVRMRVKNWSKIK